MRLLLLLVPLGAGLARAETMTRLYKPDLANTDGCALLHHRSCPGSDGLPIDLTAFCGRIKFTDPLPRQSSVTRIDIRVGLESHFAGSIFPPSPLIWAMNHAFATQPERVMGTAMEPLSDATYCTVGEFQMLSIEGKEFEEGIPFYNYGGVNYAQIRSAEDGGGANVDLMELTFHYEPAAVVAFDLSPSVSEIQRRVLIHKFGTTDSYFSAAQEGLRNTAAGADRRIEISGTVTSADGAPIAGKKIELRVTDPPDTAPYVPVARRVPGDNADPAAGRFEETSDSGLTVLVRTTEVTSDASGRFSVPLRVTNFASGDNYRVEASSLPNFGNTSSCGTANNCYSSGTLVAWKRAYLEVGRMLKHGSFIAITANAGDTDVQVADRKPFAPGNRILLIHGPASRIGPSSPNTEFWSTERTISPDGVVADQSGPGGRLTFIEPLTSEFLGIDNRSSYPSVIADFVGIVSGNAEQDFYELNLAYIKPLFSDAFTDYVVMAPAALPFVNVIAENSSASPPEEMHPFVLRWFQNYGRSNHQLAFSSRESGMFATHNARGVTRAFNGVSSSHVMVPKILGLLATQNSRRLLGEATAHEIAHQWHTNRRSSHTTSNGEHCGNFKYYDFPTKMCLMHDTYNDPQTGTLPEFMDDIVRFHYVVTPLGVDSEYRWIRERCEPVPAQLFAGMNDWWTQLSPPCR